MMKTNIIQKAFTVFLSLTFSISFPTENSWRNSFFNHSSYYIIAGGLLTTLITGEIIRHFYQTYYSLPNNKNIENYRLTYKNICQEVQNYHSFYQNDAQKSDWELKNTILCNNQNTYPFMAYYASLLKASWRIQRHIQTINKQLTEIKNHYKKLDYYRHSEKTPHLKEAFIQLKKKGKSLLMLATQTTALVTILQNRVKMFKEYEDDSNNWAQADLSKKFESISPSLQS